MITLEIRAKFLCAWTLDFRGGPYACPGSGSDDSVGMAGEEGTTGVGERARLRLLLMKRPRLFLGCCWEGGSEVSA